MEILPSQLLTFNWYGIFLPKLKFSKISFHPWRVQSISGNEIMLKNLTTEKVKIVSFKDFNKYFATKERLQFILDNNQNTTS